MCNPFVLDCLTVDQKTPFVELLAPAADAEVAMAAIDAGADAVYIGGPAFGARARAGNSLQDLERVVRYAHRYAARCFLTLNTLIYEQQMPQALQLARQAYDMGMDALLIQDMGLIEAGLPPIELHASTQCHITTPEKARFLESVGFRRLVLGRELSMAEIRRIAVSVQAEIETFIHGALCVSYSGQCYMSCYMNGRSGNRGECAQSCRLAYNLENDRGNLLQKERYLLSMKDFNADGFVEELLSAGVSCLKIEGRLKDAVYVKNITAYYRRRIDEILSGNPSIQRLSHGRTETGPLSDLQKSYHREYTGFNLSGKRGDWAVFGTPKATGEKVGRIKSVEKYLPGRYAGMVLRVVPESQKITLSAGDGLCYYGKNGKLCGNNLENCVHGAGSDLLTMQAPKEAQEVPEAGGILYRNQNKEFENAWKNAKISRKIPVEIQIDTERLLVEMCDDYGNCVESCIDAVSVQPATNPKLAEAALHRAFLKMGDTAYEVRKVSIVGEKMIFVPAAVLNECRRNLVSAMDKHREEAYFPEPCEVQQGKTLLHPELKDGKLFYTANVANSWAEKFYRKHGASSIEKAFELLSPKEKEEPGRVLMVCKHCIRHQLGQCLKDNPEPEYQGDLYLCYGRHKFALRFDCVHCRMEVCTC